MKELGLQELLRYAVAGGVGLASLLLMYPNLACLIGRVDSAAKVSLILGAVLVFGTLVYNIHRALLFPPFFRAIGLMTISQTVSRWERFIQFCQFWLWWLPSKDEIGIDRWRWELPHKDRDRWDAWAAHAHSLYCAAWAAAASFWLGRYITLGCCAAGSPSCSARLIFLALFGVSLLSGVVNNFRLLYYINEERSAQKVHPLHNKSV
jgi:hypothetical protein